MGSLKLVLVTIFVTGAVSVAATRYYWPKTVTKIETKEVVRKDVRTVIREVVHKDGTKETVTEILDRSSEKRQSTKEVFKSSDWLVSTSYGLRMDRLSDTNRQSIYGLQVQRRVLGPFFLGASATTDKVYSFMLGMEF